MIQTNNTTVTIASMQDHDIISDISEDNEAILTAIREDRENSLLNRPIEDLLVPRSNLPYVDTSDNESDIALTPAETLRHAPDHLLSSPRMQPRPAPLSTNPSATTTVTIARNSSPSKVDKSSLPSKDLWASNFAKHRHKMKQRLREQDHRERVRMRTSPQGFAARERTKDGKNIQQQMQRTMEQAEIHLEKKRNYDSLSAGQPGFPLVKKRKNKILRKNSRGETRRLSAERGEQDDSTDDDVVDIKGYRFWKITRTVWDATLELLEWFVSILRTMTKLAKMGRWPIAAGLLFFLTAWIAGHTYQYALGSLQSSLQPLCAFPPINKWDMICNVKHTRKKTSKKGAKPDFPHLIELQTNFEKVLESSFGGSTLALDMKQSEVAIRDLSTLVRLSQLSCRDTLSTHLDDFANNARITSRSLQKLGSRVNGAIDSILAMDEWALRTLRGIEVREATFPYSLYKSWWIFPVGNRDRAEVSETFMTSSEIMGNHLNKLIVEAETIIHSLDNLQIQLESINEVVQREDGHIKREHKDVLTDLMTYLGGNRKRLAQFDAHIRLLSNIAVYRTRAIAHVSATLIQLQQMSADLEELRERVAAPSLLSEVQVIPLEQHIDSISRGIERLSTGRTLSKDREKELLRNMLAQHESAAASIGTIQAEDLAV